VLAGWTRSGLPGRLLRWFNAITPAGDTRADLERALQQAREALTRGDAVCLFAEGVRTADGQSLTFSQIYQEVTGARRVPVVPVSLLQPHGSLLSRPGGRFVRKWPVEFAARVSVTFGEPLPAGTPGAQARQALQETSALAHVAQTPRRRPVHRQF